MNANAKSSMLVVPALGLSLFILAAHAKAATYKEIVLNDSPLYYWTFDEESGNALNYGSGSGGIMGGNNGVRAASGATNGGLDMGSASSHNGLGTQRFYTSSAAGGTSFNDSNWASYVLEFWVNPVSNTASYLMDRVDASGGSTNNSPAIIYGFTSDSQQNGIEIYRGANGRTAGGSNTLLSTGQWSHIVLAVKNNGVDPEVNQIFINGQLAHTANLTPVGFDASNSSNFMIGATYFDSNKFNGIIDEVALYNLTNLSQSAFNDRVASIVGHYSAVPEPCGLAMLSLAGLLMGAFRHRTVSSTSSSK